MENMDSLIGAKVESFDYFSSSEDVIFSITTDRGVLYFCHRQQCFEMVDLEEVVGDPSFIIGKKITSFEEVSSDDAPDPEFSRQSWTWTFYRLDTTDAEITLRFLGRSNGYYSETVDVKWEENR